MHAGSLTGDSAAARVYRRLREAEGTWVGAWDLTLDCRTTAVSTRISEVRHRLADAEWDVESRYEGGRWAYRLARRELEPMLC
jgi:hypothetical protein